MHNKSNKVNDIDLDYGREKRVLNAACLDTYSEYFEEAMLTHSIGNQFEIISK